MKIQLPIFYSQKDSRWAKKLLGFNTNPVYNFYDYGCLVTCLAMLCRYYGKQDDPLSINNKLKEKSGFVAGGGNYIWGSITKVYTDITEVVTNTPLPLTDDQLGAIRGQIDNGYPVMCQIDANPQTDAPDMHFVLVVGYNPMDENDLTIADPLTGNERSLKAYLGWFKPSARKSIDRFVFFKGTKPESSIAMIEISKDSYFLYTKNHDQWHKLVHYLLPDADPNATLFEAVQSVIAGIKSRVTDLENQLKDKILELEKANTEITNQKDKVANTIADCQTQLKLKEAEYTALKATLPDIEKLRGEYQGTIDELRGKVTELEKAGGKKDLQITDLNKQVELLKKGLPNASVYDKIIAYIKRLKKKS